MRNQRGVALAPVVVFAFLSIVAMTTFLFFYSSWQELEQQRRTTKKLTGEKKKEFDALSNKLRKIEALIGFYEEDERSVNVPVLVENLNKINKNEESPGTKQYYGLKGVGSVPIEEGKLADTDYPLKVETVIAAFERRIDELQKKEKTLQKAIRSLESEKEQKQQDYSEIKNKQNAVLEDLERRNQDLAQKMDDILDQVREQKNDANAKRLEAEERRKKLEEEIKAEKISSDNTVGKKKAEIRRIQAAKYGRTDYSEITEEKVFEASLETSDGEVSFVSPEISTVYLNIGRKNKVYRGLKFDVYRSGERGSKQFKGRLEVQRVINDELCEAAVKEVKNQFDPIVLGDLIINPIFNEDQPVYVAFAGEFSTVENARAFRMVRQVGGNVERDVTSRTNFVVVGEKNGKEHPNYAKALRFQIPIMTEKTLLGYVGD